MKVYLLFYDEDGTGTREEWNVFYTPCEVFPLAQTRKDRIAYIKSKYPELQFHAEDLELQTTHDFPCAYDGEDDGDE